MSWEVRENHTEDLTGVDGGERVVCDVVRDPQTCHTHVGGVGFNGSTALTAEAEGGMRE